MIELHAVAHRYGSHQALLALSLRLEGPQLIALIGANGAGKSTLIRALVGEIDPSESVMELSQIVEHLENAGLRPVVDSTFALEEYVPAFDKLRDGCFGKVVIEP